MYQQAQMIARIKAEKIRRGLSNDEFADLSGVPRGTVNRVLSGATKDPQISTIIKMAHALEVSADFLIFGKAPAEPKYQALAVQYSKLDTVDRAKAEAFIEGLLAADKYHEEKKEKRA